MKVKLDMISKEIVEQYNLKEIFADGRIHIKIRKGIYGIPQVGIVANNKLKKHLAKYGYYLTKLTPGLWRHKSKNVAFTLTADDF